MKTDQKQQLPTVLGEKTGTCPPKKTTKLRLWLQLAGFQLHSEEPKRWALGTATTLGFAWKAASKVVLDRMIVRPMSVSV